MKLFNHQLLEFRVDYLMTAHTPKRVLLLGATGMLGAYLAKSLPKHFTTSFPAPGNEQSFTLHDSNAWPPTRLDFSNSQNLDELLEQCKPDVIINCIAVTPHSNAAADSIEYIHINSLFPHLLARSARAFGCKLIHFSTDGVFSGKRGNYAEYDLPDPPDMYGRSKLLGEISDGDCLTLRTTFYGLSSGNKGLLDWLITQRGGHVIGFKNYIFSGVSMGALASALVAIIGRPVFPGGLYHLGGPAMSKFDLLTMVSERFGLSITVEPVFAPVVNRTMDSSRFWEMIGQDMPQTVTMIDGIYRDRGI
ncbi:MAG: SDR family oxidoreductase [candidate division Zixibacteria bacterium]|nr:SDR family oxidoreductase [candidate division Zixibacteria bacterium]